MPSIGYITVDCDKATIDSAIREGAIRHFVNFASGDLYRGFVFFALIFQLFQSVGQEFILYPENHKRLVQGVDFSEDGEVMYFALPHKEYKRSLGMEYANEPRLSIYSSSFVNGSWSEPELVSFSGVFKDYEPTLSPDGRIIFFNSNKPEKGTNPEEKNNIWFAEWNGDGWMEPRYLSLNSPNLEESYATVSSNGKLYYVAESIKNGASSYGVYEAVFKGERTAIGTLLDLVDAPYECGDPYISPNGDFLIYTRYDPNNWAGSCDLFISTKKADKWSKGVPLQELNSEGPDFSPTVSQDGRWIYYRKNYQFVKVDFQSLLKDLAY